MKFGVLANGVEKLNIGDIVQTKGVLRIYKEMGIEEKDIIQVPSNGLSTYDGEYVILPLAAWFNYLPFDKRFPLSPKIIPVFVGFHCTDEKIIEKLQVYKNHFPILCRDTATMSLLRGYDIEAYTSGCMSLCLERRTEDEKQNKVFIVDIPDELRAYIPKELMEGAIEVHHETFYQAPPGGKEASIKLAREKADEIYDTYKNEAKLVITSRIHCAFPCIAMGIPVIFARRFKDDLDRCAGYEALFHAYLQDEYHEIDWNPKPIDTEWLKNMQIKMVSKLLKRVYDDYNEACDISAYFEKNTVNGYYFGDQRGYLTQRQKEIFYEKKYKEKSFLSYLTNRELSETNLIIFGAGDKGKYMLRRYFDEVLQFKSCVFVDNNVKLHGKKIEGFEVISPEILNKFNRSNTMVIVAALCYYEGTGREILKELINKYHMEEGIDFFMLDKLDNSAKMAISKAGLISSLM